MRIPSYFTRNSALDPCWKDQYKQNKNHLHRKLIHKIEVFTAWTAIFHDFSFSQKQFSHAQLLATSEFWNFSTCHSMKQMIYIWSQMPSRSVLWYAFVFHPIFLYKLKHLFEMCPHYAYVFKLLFYTKNTWKTRQQHKERKLQLFEKVRVGSIFWKMPKGLWDKFHLASLERK